MNPRVANIGGSIIREVAAKRRPGSIDLGLGEPSLKPTARYLESATRWAADNGLRYTPNAGEPELREAIAAHYAYPGMSRAANVCVMNGSQEAVFVSVMTLLDPARDEMLVVEPAFPAYAKMGRLHGIDVRTVAMDAANDFAFEPARILNALTERTRLIVLCSPCNPTARVVDRATVDAIAGELERRSAPVYVLHDEIYREQTFIGDAGYFAAVYPRTIVTNSLSKSNALTGLRIGWTIVPDDLSDAVVKAHAWVTSCASTFAQRVAAEIFSEGALREHVAWYAEHRAKVVTALEESGLRFIPPQGSFYACVKLPDGTKSLEAAHSLADRHDVIVIPGIAFGDAFEGWLRLSWVSPISDVREGVARIAAFAAARKPSASAPV